VTGQGHCRDEILWSAGDTWWVGERRAGEEWFIVEVGWDALEVGDSWIAIGIRRAVKNRQIRQDQKIWLVWVGGWVRLQGNWSSLGIVKTEVGSSKV
jgi:hypothetical protein